MPKVNSTPVASSIPFVDEMSLYDTEIDTVSLALNNIRQQRVSEINARDTDSESSYSLVYTDNTFQGVTGSGSGYFIMLPDATTCLVGQEFEISNQSDNNIEVRDSNGSVLVTLVSGDLARMVLEDKSLPIGNWLLQISSTTATGIQSYVISSNTNFITGSSSLVQISGFTVIPISGRYSLGFSSDLIINSNNKTATCAAFIDTTEDINSRRLVQGVGSNFNSSFNTIGEVTVDGTEVVSIYVAVTSSTITVGQRSLILTRLGS